MSIENTVSQHNALFDSEVALPLSLNLRNHTSVMVNGWPPVLFHLTIPTGFQILSKYFVLFLNMPVFLSYLPIIYLPSIYLSICFLSFYLQFICYHMQWYNLSYDLHYHLSSISYIYYKLSFYIIIFSQYRHFCCYIYIYIYF